MVYSFGTVKCTERVAGRQSRSCACGGGQVMAKSPTVRRGWLGNIGWTTTRIFNTTHVKTITNPPSVLRCTHGHVLVSSVCTHCRTRCASLRLKLFGCFVVWWKSCKCNQSVASFGERVTRSSGDVDVQTPVHAGRLSHQAVGTDKHAHAHTQEPSHTHTHTHTHTQRHRQWPPYIHSPT